MTSFVIKHIKQFSKMYLCQTF
ncbi:MAG: hypothetical protein KGH88_07365 [Thaumarchaeota archaeon]|nr:hypothetical protein [Nitrososphaerota archaeon]